MPIGSRKLYYHRLPRRPSASYPYRDSKSGKLWSRPPSLPPEQSYITRFEMTASVIWCSKYVNPALTPDGPHRVLSTHVASNGMGWESVILGSGISMELGAMSWAERLPNREYERRSWATRNLDHVLLPINLHGETQFVPSTVISFAIPLSAGEHSQARARGEKRQNRTPRIRYSGRLQFKCLGYPIFTPKLNKILRPLYPPHTEPMTYFEPDYERKACKSRWKINTGMEVHMPQPWLASVGEGGSGKGWALESGFDSALDVKPDGRLCGSVGRLRTQLGWSMARLREWPCGWWLMKLDGPSESSRVVGRWRSLRV